MLYWHTHSNVNNHADPETFLRGGGGVQTPRRGLTEYFNMAKINNLAIPGGGGSGPPVPPLDPPMTPGLFCLLAGISSKNVIKITPYTPKNKSGLIQLIMMGESIRQRWVKITFPFSSGCPNLN